LDAIAGSPEGFARVCNTDDPTVLELKHIGTADSARVAPDNGSFGSLQIRKRNESHGVVLYFNTVSHVRRAKRASHTQPTLVLTSCDLYHRTRRLPQVLRECVASGVAFVPGSYSNAILIEQYIAATRVAVVVVRGSKQDEIHGAVFSVPPKCIT
jgi:hypothetical protein